MYEHVLVTHYLLWCFIYWHMQFIVMYSIFQGLLLDSAIEENLITRHLQVADAARATLGMYYY